MEKLSVFGRLQKSIDTLKSTECSQQEKLAHFGQITDSLLSAKTGPANVSFQNHLSAALGTLLMFCEETDSCVRMSAEENLNRIVRFCERNGAIVRVQIDLYHEIKKNGHERSLRICLALFGYYCGTIKQRKGKIYAQNLLPCIFAISKRRETQLLESLAAFVKIFTETLGSFMTDGEVLKMTEIFVEDLNAECATKRRCAAKNIDSFIAWSRSPEFYANIVFNRCIEILLKNQEQNAVLGVLASFRGILPVVLKSCSVDKAVEIFDLLLHFLKESSHSVINATLEVIGVIFNHMQPGLRKVLLSESLEHRRILLKRKTLKNSVFKINLSESLLSSRKSSTDARVDCFRPPDRGLSLLQVSSTPTKFASGDDKSLASASDLEMDSFRSMELDNSSPEKERKPSIDTLSLRSQKSSDSLGSFISTFLTTSSNAGESMSKFFRKPFDLPADTSRSRAVPDEEDHLSLESLTSSQISIQSSNAETIRNELDVTLEVDDSVASTTASVAAVESTPSVTLAVGNAVPERETPVAAIASAMKDHDEPATAEITPDARNLFIGSIHDQNMLDYAVRLIASRFLLAGTKHSRRLDHLVRVSVKTMALQTIAQCVQLRPELLLLALEKEEPKEEFDVVEILNLEDAINEISNQAILEVDEGALAEASVEPDAGGLLEMKEDHFGECTSSTYFEFFSPMSISLDQGLTSLKTKLKLVEENFCTMANDNQEKLSRELDAILSQSDCSGDVARRSDRRKELLVVPRVVTSKGDLVTRCLEAGNSEDQQMIADVLLFYDHVDQSLRGNVLLLLGNFLHVVLEKFGSVEHFLAANDRQATLGGFLRQDALLQMIVLGFSDEIHTVVNQALTAFEQIFGVYCRNQLSTSCRRKTPGNGFSFKSQLTLKQNLLLDDIEAIELNPQLLIEKFLLTFHNRYWLVQCKVCDVIAKMDYRLLQNVVGLDMAANVHNRCREQLIILLRDGDPRVRNYAGEQLIRYLENIYQREFSSGTHISEEDTIEDFVKKHILAGFAEPIDRRRLETIGDAKLFTMKAAPLFYILSNQLLNVGDRNQLFGVINFFKLLIGKYNPFDLAELWCEFNILNVLLSLMSEHTGTALDLTAQTDLLEICSNLMIVTLSSRNTISAGDNEVMDKFIFHLLKLMNIYQHLFTNQRPIIISRAQKGDLFMNAKELQLINCFGYFGNDHFYLKLYNVLWNSFESYKITISVDVGCKLFELLRTTIASLWRLLEMKSISAMSNGLKFMEEVIRYLMVFLPYEPERCVQCTRYLLRFLFSGNYANCRQEVEYFRKARETQYSTGARESRDFSDRYYELCKLRNITAVAELSNYIKQFEPVVIACLKIFSRTTTRVQTAILDMLCQLLDYSINYHMLDSSNVFVDYVFKHVELLETGMIQDAEQLIGKIVKFLFLLSQSKDRSKIVTIPKIINICDNLLANGMIRGVAIASLQALALEIFFLNRLPLPEQENEVLLSELATQKEVVLNMIMKFPEEVGSYEIVPMVLLFEGHGQAAKYQVEISSALVGVMLEGKLPVRSDREWLIVQRTMEALSQGIKEDDESLSNCLAILFETAKTKDCLYDQKVISWQIILEKVVLKLEETQLLESLKLFLNKEPSINANIPVEDVFGKLLNEMLMKSLENCDAQNRHPFQQKCLKRFIQTAGEFRKFPIIGKCLLDHITIDRLHLGSHDPRLRTALLEFLVEMGYDTKQLLCVVAFQHDTVGRKELYAELIGLLMKHKHAKAHWSSEEVLYLIEHHIMILLENHVKFLFKYVAMPEFSSAIVSKVAVLLNDSPSHKLLNVLEKSLLNSLPQFLGTTTTLLAHINITIARKAALVLDAKLETLQKMQPLTNELLKKVMPEENFQLLLDSLNPERRKKFPKLFKSVLALVRFYKHVDPPRDLIPRIDTELLKQLVLDDTWFMEQITYHCTAGSYTKARNISRMLYEVSAESKLINLLSVSSFNAHLLREVIDTAFENMFHAFRKDCIQFNPHLNYLKVHPMLKVALIVLMRKLNEINIAPEDELNEASVLHYVKAVIRFLVNLDRLDHLGLLYVDARFIDRFVKDYLLKSNFFETLLIFARIVAKLIQSKIKVTGLKDSTNLELHLTCLDLILKQKYLWMELNQNDKFREDQELYVRVIFDVLKVHLRDRLYLDRYQPPEVFTRHFPERYDELEVYLQVILIAQLILEAPKSLQHSQLLRPLESLSISVLKIDRFFPMAMTPGEVFNCYSIDVDVEPLRLPSVPIDYLYEVDTLEEYLKRVNIFGYSSRQQFEELFMSLLVLINKEGDPDVINYQEQHQIKRMCLRSIADLLLSCYRYPRIGFSDGKFYHVPRNTVLKCDSVSLKKLHSIQLLIPLNNVFYQPNLERSLLVSAEDNLCCFGDNSIGTRSFGMNQFGIQYAWHNMEGIVNESLVAKNIHYFIEKANLDVMSSVQLMYDIFGQLLEDFALILPHLVPFCEICENRDQIRQLYDLVLGLQERVAMEDSLSQQYIIYLLCKMAALLVPTMAELSHLCSIIPTYLKSTQLYTRNATLSGLLALLECLVASNTTMGGLSEELQLVRNITVNYIVKHGIIDESSTAYSDAHIKLVWTLNFYLIENTSRFVSECNLLSNSIISANNILKRTTNLEIYLCILNGLERLVLTGTPNRPLLEKIEKLALDLVKLDNEMFSLAALKLLLSCIYHSSADQLENTERCNGIVQDEPEIIIQQIEKIEILFAKIRTTTPSGAKVFGDVLCQLIRDLLPPNEILTKVFKELMLNQPNPDIIATVTYQVFRSAIDSSCLALLQEWLLCSLPNFLSLPQINKSVWCLTVVFLSASLNQHLLKVFPEVLSLPSYQQLNEREVTNFILSAKDFYRQLEASQKARFKQIFQQCDCFIYQSLLRCL
ncbi:huntingtin [Wyeomyia smithii]|uniref:huntingtin n=1 Tax=Wyeomyia smithii TaxID=174621 RepID=UPI002467DA33|nr:huntingtin [Wyeomyia smithii]